jgi:type III secretion system YscD/HrpQ family protein
MSHECGDGNDLRFLVKLLSGPHAGAEIELDSRDSMLHIGSGGDEDLVLSDALVSADHAELFLADNALQIKSTGGIVFLDGKQIDKNEQVKVENFQFITIGLTHLVAGPADGEWPRLTAQDAPPLETAAENYAAGNADEATGVSSSEPDAIKAEKLSKEQKTRTLRRVGIFFTILGILAFGLIAISLTPKKKRMTTVELEKVLQAQVADMNYMSTVSVRKNREQIVIDGYVPTNMEVRELRTSLMATYPGIHYNVRSTEKISETLEEMLRSADGAFRVVPLQPGVFSIVGYTLNGDAWQTLRMRLVSDVAGVKKIRNDVMTPDKVASVAQDIFAANGLRNIAAEPEAHRIFFHGKISSLQVDQWKAAAESLIQTFSDIIPVEFDVQTFSAQTETAINAFFPAPIQSITVGSRGLGWVATLDGKKYFSGSFLPSGWRVDAIEVGGLRLSREGKQVSMRLEELQ